jgi:hypothetical protein
MRALIWGGVLAFGLTLLGLSIYFIRIGLDRADKVSIVLSVFVGLIGLTAMVLGIAGSALDYSISEVFNWSYYADRKSSYN